jgi:hypothetical protein
MTLAQDIQQAGEIMIEHTRETALLAFSVMTDGLPEQYGAEARKVLKFFEEETTPQFWARLAQTIDPTTGKSIADGMLAQWQQLAQAVGGKHAPTHTPTVQQQAAQPTGGY